MLKLTPPPRTTEALGEEVATELAQWITEVFDTFRVRWVTRDEYREILSRMDILEHDMSGLKAEVLELRRETSARFDAMEERFDTRFDYLQSETNARFDRLQSEMNARFDTVNTRIDTIHEVVRSQTRWLIATLIALGGLISVLITIFGLIR